MTIAQVLFDALAWCRYFAVNESIGRPEVKLIFYEAFQYVYNEASISHPEFFTKSQTITGPTTSVSLPADYRKPLAIVVNDAGCSAGAAKIVPSEEWSVRQSNTRTKGTATDPIAREDQTTIVLSNSVTSGKLYYIRNYAESDLSTESTDLKTVLPVIFQPLLLSKMQELIRVRHFRADSNPTVAEKQVAVMRASARNLKRSLRPLEITQGLTEKPQSIVLGGGA